MLKIKILFILYSLIIECNAQKSIQYGLDKNLSPIDTTIYAESDSFKIIHYYNDFTQNTRDEFNEHLLNPFKDSNCLVRLQLVKKKCCDTIFNIPMVGLTNIVIDEKNKLIIGFSKINFIERYNFIILNFKGEILYKKRFSVGEYKLDSFRLDSFKTKYNTIYNVLKADNKIVFDSNYYYISTFYLEMLTASDVSDAEAYLSKFYISNHIFPNINSMYYFVDKLKPVDSIILENGKPLRIILNIYMNKKVSFLLEDNIPD